MTCSPLVWPNIPPALVRLVRPFDQWPDFPQLHVLEPEQP